MSVAIMMLHTTVLGNGCVSGAQGNELSKVESVDTTPIISQYDALFRRISEQQGNDWRLMSAIAYHESRFQPDVVSHCGAKGLMQIMPRVAAQFDISGDELSDVETNILVGNMVFCKIGKMLRLPAAISDKDRLSLILAAYNGGIGHVFDARRLAVAYGENPNSWDSVARYLKLKNEAEYYTNSVVKCGRFAGSGQTLAYVNNVMKHYAEYLRIAPSI